jgi:hypothetical protein
MAGLSKDVEKENVEIKTLTQKLQTAKAGQEEPLKELEKTKQDYVKSE